MSQCVAFLTFLAAIYCTYVFVCFDCVACLDILSVFLSPLTLIQMTLLPNDDDDLARSTAYSRTDSSLSHLHGYGFKNIQFESYV